MNRLLHWWHEVSDDPVLWVITITGALALYLLAFCFVPAINTVFGWSIPPHSIWCPKAFNDPRCAE